MPKILITGGSGMLGSYASAQAAEAGWETWATWSAHPVEIPGCRMLGLDIRDASAVEQVIAEVRPDVIVHTAALVRPDLCEQHKADAYAANVTGTFNIILAAEKVGAHLVHVSTDLVFDGRNSPLKEDAVHSPVNYYGSTKAAAETAIRAAGVPWAIVRTSIIYGPRKFQNLESFSDKIIDLLQSGKTLGAFIDQYRSPIPAWNLADVLLEIAERRMTGIYHAVSPEASTRFQFARKVAEIFGLDQSLVEPMSMDEVQVPAPRPKMLVLDTTATARALHTRLLGFEEGIRGLRNHQDAKMGK